MNKSKNIFLIAALLGASGIVFGALGAHALKAVLEPEKLQSFETGVRYQMYHALFLLVLGLLKIQRSNMQIGGVVWMVLLGVLLFSGSIYLLAMQSVWGISLHFLGPITPIGGVLLIAAWVVFGLKIWRVNS